MDYLRCYQDTEGQGLQQIKQMMGKEAMKGREKEGMEDNGEETETVILIEIEEMGRGDSSVKIDGIMDRGVVLIETAETKMMI